MPAQIDMWPGTGIIGHLALDRERSDRFICKDLETKVLVRSVGKLMAGDRDSASVSNETPKCGVLARLLIGHSRFIGTGQWRGGTLGFGWRQSS